MDLSCHTNRQVLDFDFEQVCSVTQATTNIYVCLMCGKLYQGRGQSTPTYLHALNEDHSLFMNLSTRKAYILPDGAEVAQDDPSLAGIRSAIFPEFTAGQIARLDRDLVRGVDLHEREFAAGFIGLNNVKQNDYLNVVLQLLAHVSPLRDLFLANDLRNLPDSPTALFVKTLALATRKIWNPSPFKAHLSPHEFIQATRTASQDKFLSTVQSDAGDFLAWTLNFLERAMASLGFPPIIQEHLKGKLSVKTTKVLLDTDMRDFYDELEGRSDIKTFPFYFLSLDLPPTPLFQDHTGKRIIPQTSLAELLAKFDGVHVTSKGETEQTFELLQLPRYLILNIKRIIKTEFGVEKNKTVVNFGVKDLVIGGARYNLVANISHAGEAKDGQYSIHMRHKGTDTWFEAQDLVIKEIHPQTIFLANTCIQLWELVH